MNGASLAEIAAVLGHKTLAMVKRYSHLSEQHTDLPPSAIPVKFVNVQAYEEDRVVTIQLSDGKRVIPAVIPGNKLRKLAETIMEMLDEYPDMENWDIPESMRQSSEAAH